jgi:hypothetical protein
MTFDQAILDILKRDFTVGLTYVTVSRVRPLRGILFDVPFDYEKFRTTVGQIVRMKEADIARRLPQHLPDSQYEQ